MITRITVARRFHRSVSLKLDWESPAALDGYVASQLVQDISQRILTELATPQGQRAWSIVGPYGTGKSAYLLHLSTLLAHPRGPQVKLFNHDPESLGSGVHSIPLPDKPWLPVLVVGERGPILDAVVKAMLEAIGRMRKNRRGRTPHIELELTEAHRALQAGEAVGSSRVLDLVDRFGEYASKRHGGTLFVFDELGKFLEHAAHGGSAHDIYFLQQLAESAARRHRFPMAVITALHQSFAHYADGLSDAERREWEKVQGRYEEIPFIEPAHHLIRLTAAAIRGQDTLPRGFQQRHEDLVNKLAERLPPGKRNLGEALLRVKPIHPVVATLFPPVFRGSLAQNERSLFAFLVSSEPGTFGAYLEKTDGTPKEPYGIADFFDYVQRVLSTRSMRSRSDRVFGLAQRVLDKLTPSGSPDKVLLLKAVAMFDRFGEEAGLQADLATLALATGLDEEAIEKHLSDLSPAVIRWPHSGAFHLADPSALDLEREIKLARQAVDRSGNVAGILQHHIDLRPVIAGRHLHATGTLRFLEPRLVEDGEFHHDRHQFAPADPANGLILYVLPRSVEAGKDLAERLHDESFRRRVLPHAATVVAIAKDASRLREQATNLLALAQAMRSSKELGADPVTIRELEFQVSVASNRLHTSLASVFALNQSARSEGAWWFTRHSGPCPAPRRLSRLASEVMDQAFRAAPQLKNELLNRDHLSTQAAKARRELVDAMISHPDQKRLGFEGFPPALAMYLSVIRASGVHHPDGPPYWVQPDGEQGRIWADLLAHIEKADRQLPIPEVYDFLNRPPYGVRGGLLPVLLVTLLLMHGDRVSLFEDGSLVTALEEDVAERLLRRPKSFSVRAYPATHRTRELLKVLYRNFSPRSCEEPTLLDVTKALLRIVKQLPEYARNTNFIDPKTKAVRTALLTARDPQALVFEKLPEALGLSDQALEQPQTYAQALRAAMDELQQAEPRLMERLRNLILTAFAAEEYTEVVKRLADLPNEGLPSLLAGLKLRSEEGAPWDEWVYSIATFLVHRPPDRWRDQDEKEFNLKLDEASRLAHNYEVLLTYRRKGTVPRMLLSIMRSDGTEFSDVVVDREHGENVKNFTAELAELAAKHGLDRSQVLLSFAQYLENKPTTRSESHA